MNQNEQQTHAIVDQNSIYPIPEEQRPITTGSYILVFWSSAIVIQIVAIGTFMLQKGFNFYQIILAGLISGLLVSVFASVNSVPGLKYGIPFTIQLRSAFGYKGAKLAFMFRIIPAILWYGIGSWIGALAIDAVCIEVFGMPSMPFIHFIWLTILHIVLGYKGISQIKWFNAVVSCVIFVMLVYFFIVIFQEGKLDFTEYTNRPVQWGYAFLAIVSASAANWATVVLNNSDLTRQLRPAKMRDSLIGNIAGILPPWLAMVFFGLLIFVSAGTDDPIAGMMSLAPNKFMGIVLLLFIIMAQITSNLTTSLLPAALALEDLFKMKWSTAAIISSLLSIFTMPWVLYTADWFFVFQNVYSSFLGPMLGIMMVDFWVVNKQSCDMAALYDESGEKYRYKNGFGVSAFLALFISALIAFWQLDIAWIIGIPSAAILYYFFKCLCKLDEKI
ncbi:cytosine permease [Massilistercora timonensis]|uniref:cytosine permease n=1 Tax=Massilistercora timonensis TaxID=2086584 RepID=UPI0032079126